MLNTSQYVAIIDVGHGNSTVLRDDTDVIVVDCGQGSSLMEFLVQENINSIDSILLSHADSDHVGGLVNLISSNLFKIKNVYVNPDSSKPTKLWDDLMYDLSQNPNVAVYTALSSSMQPFQCGSIFIKIIGPSSYLAAKSAGGSDKKGRQITSNSMSASFHIVWKEQIIAYLAGDVDQISLDDLVDHKATLKAPLLIFPHHGGKSSNADVVSFTEQLCSLTEPQTVIFSIGRRKPSNSPNPRSEVINALRAKILDVRIACTQLSKHCAINLPSGNPTHLISVFSQGQAQRECCAGTFIVKLGDPIEYWPNSKDHWKFILSFAPTALCN